MHRYFSIFLFLAFMGTTYSQKLQIYIGSYTDGKVNDGIYLYNFDAASEKLERVQTLSSFINPSFLLVSPSRKNLYTATNSQREQHGRIAAFQRDTISGRLRFLNTVDAGGRNPVHLALNKKENLLVNSNYTDPGISIHPIHKSGSVGSYQQYIDLDRPGSKVVIERQKDAHIHSTNFALDNKFLFAQDLGSDQIYCFSKRDNNNFVPCEVEMTETESGAGPRHFTFHPNGKYGYGVGELNGKVNLYYYNKGELLLKESYLTYQQVQEIYRTADVHCSPDGKFLYVSNRGPEEDTLAIFKIREDDGTLKLVGHEPTAGEHPRNFAISASGKYLVVANQFSHNVVLFQRDLQTGLLTKLSNEIKVKNPSSIQLVEAK